MILKTVTLFLIGLAVLAMFGKLRVGRRKPPRLAKSCPRCGRPRIGKDPCPCSGPPSIG